MNTNFKGVFSALLTPFDNGKVDYISLEKHVAFQIENGVNGFVVNGTTAESPTLHWSEVESIFKKVKNLAGEKIPIMIGTGTNSTEITIETTKKACALGADAVLVVVPYYNKPPQRGLVQHFNAVAEVSSAQVFLYNVPGRTITSLSEASILELAKNKKIKGIKEASGEIAQNEKLFKLAPREFIKLSGDDGTYVSFLKIGGDGIISVMSNLIPALCAKWTRQAQDKNWTQLEPEFAQHQKLISGMYVESNPIVPKWMLYKMGLFKSPEMRLPMVTLESTHEQSTLKLLKEFSLI